MRLVSRNWKRKRFVSAVSLVVLAALGSLLAGLSPVAAAPSPGVRGEGSGIYLYRPSRATASTSRWRSTVGAVTSTSSMSTSWEHLRPRLGRRHVPLSQRQERRHHRDYHRGLGILDHGIMHLAGVSYPLDRIPACSPWPLNMLMDRGRYTVSSAGTALMGRRPVRTGSRLLSRKITQSPGNTVFLCWVEDCAGKEPPGAR
jgi:hypothetical protein